MHLYGTLKQQNSPMKLFQQLQLLSRVDSLIRRKATGSPQQLANRLDISERQTYRLISSLKTMGFPVKYCHYRNSYTYEKEVKIRFEIFVDNSEAFKIQGGEKRFFSNYFFDADKKWQWRKASL